MTTNAAAFAVVKRHHLPGIIIDDSQRRVICIVDPIVTCSFMACGEMSQGCEWACICWPEIRRKEETYSTHEDETVLAYCSAQNHLSWVQEGSSTSGRLDRIGAHAVALAAVFSDQVRATNLWSPNRGGSRCRRSLLSMTGLARTIAYLRLLCPSRSDFLVVLTYQSTTIPDALRENACENKAQRSYTSEKICMRIFILISVKREATLGAREQFLPFPALLSVGQGIHLCFKVSRSTACCMRELIFNDGRSSKMEYDRVYV